MASVTFDHVWKKFGDVVAVQDLNLAIQDKEFLVLVGPSGCGKTTSLRCLAGLEEITEGKVMIGDQVVNDVAPKDRDIAMVFQSYALYPHMTVYDNMAFGLKLRKMPKVEIDRRVKQSAEILGIGNLLQRKPKELSGGQRQRIAIARAILKDAPILLLDEATSSLDSKAEFAVQQALDRLMKGRTTLIIAHRLSTIANADTIITLRNGSIDEIGSPATLATTGGIYATLLTLQLGATERAKQQLEAFDIAG